MSAMVEQSYVSPSMVTGAVWKTVNALQASTDGSGSSCGSASSRKTGGVTSSSEAAGPLRSTWKSPSKTTSCKARTPSAERTS